MDYMFDVVKYNQTNQYQKTLDKVTGYVGSNYKQGVVIVQSFELRRRVWIAPPSGMWPVEPIKQQIFGNYIDSQLWHLDILDENMYHTYTLVLGQCSKVLCNKLKSAVDYETFNEQQDVFVLLDKVGKMNFKFKDQK